MLAAVTPNQCTRTDRCEFSVYGMTRKWPTTRRISACSSRSSTEPWLRRACLRFQERATKICKHAVGKKGILWPPAVHSTAKIALRKSQFIRHTVDLYGIDIDVRINQIFCAGASEHQPHRPNLHPPDF